MKNHISTEELIEYIEGTLSSIKQAQIVKHLETCTTCQKELESLQQTFDLLMMDEVPELSTVRLANFVPNIRQKLEKSRGWRYVLPRLIPTVTGVLALLITFAVFITKENNVTNFNEVDIASVPAEVIQEEYSHLLEGDFETTLYNGSGTDAEELLGNVVDPTFVESADEGDTFFDDEFGFTDEFSYILDDLSSEEVQLIVQQINQYPGG